MSSQGHMQTEMNVKGWQQVVWILCYTVSSYLNDYIVLSKDCPLPSYVPE